MPGSTVAQNSSSAASDSNDAATGSRLRGNGNMTPVEEQPGSAAFTCKVVNIRSKRSLQTIARLSRSGPEVRRRLIEFSFQTRSSPLAAIGRRSDPSAAATSSHVAEGTAVGAAARRQDECEELLRLVVSGVIVADANLQAMSKRLLEPPQESTTAGGGAESTAGEATVRAGSSSGGAANLSAVQPTASSPPPLGQRDSSGTASSGGKTARKSYLGFSTSSSSRNEANGAGVSVNGSNGNASNGKGTANGAGLDLSAEMAFATGTEVTFELIGLVFTRARTLTRMVSSHPSYMRSCRRCSTAFSTPLPSARNTRIQPCAVS